MVQKNVHVKSVNLSLFITKGKNICDADDQNDTITVLDSQR